MASQPIYQFYAELKDFEPKIWRQFQVPGNITLSRLAYILMTIYEMQASHLFRITVPIRDNVALTAKSEIYPTFPDEIWHFEVESEDFSLGEFEEKIFNAAEYKMKSVLRGFKGEKLVLEYDFGDSWEVEVTLENIIEDKKLPGRELPRVLAGKGYGIVEDCGGTGGLKMLVEAFQKKAGADYEEYRDWLGRDDFDLTAFDVDDINLRLKKVPRIYADIYEYGYAPSKRSIDFLNREYLK